MYILAHWLFTFSIFRLRFFPTNPIGVRLAFARKADVCNLLYLPETWLFVLQKCNYNCHGLKFVFTHSHCHFFPMCSSEKHPSSHRLLLFTRCRRLKIIYFSKFNVLDILYHRLHVLVHFNEYIIYSSKEIYIFTLSLPF